MALGFPADKNSLDIRTGQIVINLRNAFDDIQRMQAWLAGKTDAELIALGYTAGEVAVLKSAFSDLNSLRQVYAGTATQASTKDFMAFAKQLTGIQ